MRSVLLISCFLKFANCISQDVSKDLPNTIWQLSVDNYVYLVYHKGNVYEITDYTKSSYPKGVITVTSKKYGFYNSCILPSVDSLQINGIYYFELDSTDSSSQEAESLNTSNACAELSFVKEDKTVLMNIYNNSRQQYGTYKKINTLPVNIRKYLKKKGIKMDFLPRK